MLFRASPRALRFQDDSSNQLRSLHCLQTLSPVDSSLPNAAQRLELEYRRLVPLPFHPPRGTRGSPPCFVTKGLRLAAASRFRSCHEVLISSFFFAGRLSVPGPFLEANKREEAKISFKSLVDRRIKPWRFNGKLPKGARAVNEFRRGFESSRRRESESAPVAVEGRRTYAVKRAQ